MNVKNKNVKMDSDKKIGNAILVFQTFQKVNVASLLYNKSIKTNSIMLSWVYVIIPIVIYLINMLFLIHSNVLYSSTEYFTYCNDLSNSLGLSLLFFVSYFLSGYYSRKVDAFIKNGIKIDSFNDIASNFKNKKKSYVWLFFIWMFFAIVGYLSGASFYSVAKSNKNAFWIQNLSEYGRIYYSIFLGITWYHSLLLLGMALSSGFMIYWCLKEDIIIYYDEFYNKNLSIIEITDILISTFSYGLFYIISSALFILNDKIAANSEYKIENTFSNNYAALILIFVVISIVVLASIPLNELMKYMIRKREELLNKLNILLMESESTKESVINKRNEIVTQPVIYTSLSNKLVVVFSIIVPALGVILQAIELLGNM